MIECTHSPHREHSWTLAFLDNMLCVLGSSFVQICICGLSEGYYSTTCLRKVMPFTIWPGFEFLVKSTGLD